MSWIRKPETLKAMFTHNLFSQELARCLLRTAVSVIQGPPTWHCFSQIRTTSSYSYTKSHASNTKTIGGHSQTITVASCSGTSLSLLKSQSADCAKCRCQGWPARVQIPTVGQQLFLLGLVSLGLSLPAYKRKISTVSTCKTNKDSIGSSF